MSSSFLQPNTLQEALAARAEHKDYELIAGGTDLLVASKDRKAPVGTIDLFGVAGLSEVEDDPAGGVRIGAATSYQALLADSRIASGYSLLHAACREVGASQIQARGTIGGNVATSSPVGDSLPALMALDAVIEVANSERTRRIPYAEFLTGYRQIDLADDELIVAICLPRQDSAALQYWRKVGTRRAQSISKVMIAALGVMEAGKIATARIGLGAVADRTLRARAVEGAILGQPANAATAELARQALRSEISPIDDVRSRAEYRLGVAENLVARFVLRLGNAPGQEST